MKSTYLEAYTVAYRLARRDILIGNIFRNKETKIKELDERIRFHLKNMDVLRKLFKNKVLK